MGNMTKQYWSNVALILGAIRVTNWKTASFTNIWVKRANIRIFDLFTRRGSVRGDDIFCAAPEKPVTRIKCNFTHYRMTVDVTLDFWLLFF